MEGGVTLLFPMICHRFQVDYFKTIQKDLVDFCYQERKRDPQGRQLSNRGGWQSSPFEPHKDMDKFDNILTQTIQQNITKYFEVNKVTNPGVMIQFHNMWININKKNSYNVLHCHPGSNLAGVFWLKSPKEGGNLNCYSPYAYTRHEEIMSYDKEFATRAGQYIDYNFYPKEGDMVLFPSCMLHAVLPNKSREERISVSFNLTLVCPDEYKE